MPTRATVLLLLALVFVLPHPAAAQLRLARIFGDGMVMQRGAVIPVRGTATPGVDVVVTFDGTPYPARVDADGTWLAALSPRPAGGPYVMTVEAGDERLAVRDILVGDVWVASGQSNMEWTVADARDAAKEIAAADDPAIRHFKVPRSWAPTPAADLTGGAWTAADPAHVGAFTAVGYFFARELREHVDVPIGLVNTSWGGSRIEPWMSAGALGLGPDAVEAVLARERASEERVREALRARIGAFPEEDPGLVDGRAVWADPTLDDAGWETLAVPGTWEAAGYEGMDGVAWYRTTFELTPAQAQAGVTLGLGAIDDSDVSYVNGHEVGRTSNAWNVARAYDVPASALQAGRNVVTVRVEDTGGGGGILGPPDQLFVAAGGERRPLAGAWKFRVGAVSANPQGQKHQTPTLLYNQMVHPLLDFPVAGVIWYQGESNANTVDDAVAYRKLFADMITSWRSAWGRGDLPFLFVQLANFMGTDAEPPVESNWAVLRESQTAALALPNTGQAVIIDIGEADDIHPRNKQDVGARLALAARKVAYGQDLVYSGPVYRSHEVVDGRVVVSFDHVGGGLVAHGGPLKGFAVAGADGRFVWADAAIEGDRVVVWSDRVAEPVAVRYAWGNNPDDANLYNAEGLPANPFRAGEAQR